MKKWSKEERILREYFRHEVRSYRKIPSGDGSLKELAVQCLSVALGLLFLIALGSVKKPGEFHDLDRGISIVMECFSETTAF